VSRRDDIRSAHLRAQLRAQGREVTRCDPGAAKGADAMSQWRGCRKQQGPGIRPGFEHRVDTESGTAQPIVSTRDGLVRDYMTGKGTTTKE
jgi:hypothetical protein